MEDINGFTPESNVEYTEDNIRHLDDMRIAFILQTL